MNKFRIEIDCDNAAFKNPEDKADPAAELASILEHYTVHKLRMGTIESPLFDTNGNRVGRATMKPDLSITAKVSVLNIAHRHGTNITVHMSEEGARRGLADYCEEWWEHEIQRHVGAPVDFELPDNDDTLIEKYFEMAEDESWSIEATPIKE